MKVVMQRSLNSKVSVEEKIVGQIEKGLVLLVSFTHTDKKKDIEEMIDKIIHLRIFDDEKGKMNKSLLEVEGSILSISQFTLYANTRKGRRPSYKEALNGEEAVKLYDLFNEKLKQQKINVETGIFGANMKVEITNDGPVTILLESGKPNENK